MPKVEFLTRQQKRERTVDEIIDIYRKRKHITKSDLAHCMERQGMVILLLGT